MGWSGGTAVKQPGGAGEGADVKVLELVADPRPGRGLVGGARAGLDYAGQEQREPAEQDLGADAVFEAMSRFSGHP